MNDRRYAILETNAKFHRYKNRVYVYTFLAYGILHLARKCYTNMKIKLEAEAGFDPTFLSVMDTVFMLCYATGSFFSGKLGRQLAAPVIVSLGLLGSAACVMTLAIFVWLDIESIDNNDFLRTLAPLLLWMVHGFMQSTGGPANTTIMSNWFGSRNRGLIFGTWTCHQYIGNIAAGLISSVILFCPAVPWTLALVIPALANAAWGLFVWRYLPERPENIGLDPKSPVRASGLGIWEAARIPNVLGYSLAFGLFKFVNYALFFWLPFYLSLIFSPGAANLTAVLYDVGMIPGGILVGAISDVYGGRRACVIATFTVTLIPFLFIFAEHTLLSSLSTPAVLVLLGIMGALIGGPINIITSAVAVDLAETVERSDLMTLTGLINGSGSIIAALGLALIGPLQVRYGWQRIWYLLMLCTAVGTMLLSPIIVKELRRTDASDSEGISLLNRESDAGPRRNYQTVAPPLPGKPPNRLTLALPVPSHSDSDSGVLTTDV